MNMKSWPLKQDLLPEDTKIIISRTIGTIGMLFPITGNFLPPSTTRALFFVIGCILMLISAMMERELFFTVLQLVILAGAVAVFTPFSLPVRAAIPIGCTIACLLFFALTGRLRDGLTFFGSIGIAILALGYAVADPMIYFLGGSILAIYSTISFRRGVSIALLWAILNYVFAIAAAINIYRFVL